jgi:chain length determinant protein tyrosine kinase EpsG
MRFSFRRKKPGFGETIVGEPADGTEVPTAEVRDRTIGEIMVVAKVLTPVQVDAVLAHQRERGTRFGDTAIELGYTEPEDVLWALSQQFEYPYSTTKGAPLHQELYVANEPFSDDVEAFRDLRSHLLMTVMAPEDTRRALAVVSANIGDGKTFIAANLAVAFSQLPGRTLIVDADMRSPRLHEVFGLDNVGGLSSILSGRAEASVIRPVPSLPNLHVLPVGTVPPNPLELVQRNNFRLLLEELSSKFDYVVVDTPAAAHGSDARLIAARSGAALVVSRRHQTHVKPVQKLVAQLTKAQVLMAGVVMNDY